MRGALFVAALCIVAPPALACTVSNPYRPLTTPPAGAETLLVDVVALDFRTYPTIVQIRVVQGGEPAADTRAIRHWPALCGGSRDPRKGDRLYVYIRGDHAIGWATPAEVKAFGDRSTTTTPHALESDDIKLTHILS